MEVEIVEIVRIYIREVMSDVGGKRIENVGRIFY